jgi:ABC-2 type transport system permease protein
MRSHYIVDVAQREFLTVLRTRMTLLLGAGYVALVGVIGWAGASGAYLALVLDALTPTEVLVPVLAFAVGYRSILSDRASGELETLHTYPIHHGGYVLGVYTGRAVFLVAAILLGAGAAAVFVPMSQPEQLSVIASHGTVDSPALFLRFALLTAVYALVVLAIALLVSAAARSTRSGLALAAGAMTLLVVGLDTALVGAVTGGLVSTGGTTALLAASPTSAYRSLVFEFSVAPAGLTVPSGPTALVSSLGLLGWLIVALGLAAVLAWR